MLKKHYLLLCHSSYNANKKIVGKTMSCAFQVIFTSGILFTKQIFGWHIFRRKIKCFIDKFLGISETKFTFQMCMCY